MNDNIHVIMKTFAHVLMVIVKLRFVNDLSLPMSDSLLFGICKQSVLQHGADFLSLHNVSANSYFIDFMITVSHTNTTAHAATKRQRRKQLQRAKDCVLY